MQNCTCALIMTAKILMARNGKGQQRNIKEVFCFMRFCISSLFIYSKRKKKNREELLPKLRKLENHCI